MLIRKPSHAKQKGTLPRPPDQGGLHLFQRGIRLKSYNLPTSMAKTTSTPFKSLSAGEFLSRNAAPLSWTSAGLFIAANILLSYFPLTLTQALWVILVGLLLPAVLLLFIPIKNISLKAECLPKIPLGAWMAATALAVFLRLFKLDSLSSWPTVDEGVYAYFSTALARHWDWRLLISTSQVPAVYCWGHALLFKLFSPSLFTLWLYPAIWSLACLPLALWAGRKAFSPSTSFFVLFFMASGFWPLYLGRLSIHGGFFLAAEFLLFGSLAFYLESPEKKRTPRLAALTLITGLGFYTYLAWPLVAAWIGLVLLFQPLRNQKEKSKNILIFGLGNMAALLPLVLTYHREYRGYFHHVWVGPHWGLFIQNLPLAFSYFRNLFWGLPASALSMGPVWGGLFNPVVTALFCVGAAVPLRTRTRVGFLWACALVLFFQPALLTSNLEMTRLTPLIPVIFTTAAFGLQFLGAQASRFRRPLLLGLILLASLAFDLFHFIGVYPDHWRKHPDYYGAQKSPEYARAYTWLETQQKKQGPGLILLHFVPDPYDQTLAAAVAGFNVAWDPDLTSNPTWAALLANIHSGPALSARFPEGRWVWLSQGLNRPDGGLLLGLIPLTSANRETIKKWTLADQALDPLIDQVLERGVDMDQTAMLQTLQGAYPGFQGDPFLEPVFWRLSAIHEAASGRYAGAVADETKALQKAPSQADLLNERGCLRIKTGDLLGAKKDFKLAIQCRPDYTNALENLRMLQAAGK
jgi:hypothetical protein